MKIPAIRPLSGGLWLAGLGGLVLGLGILRGESGVSDYFDLRDSKFVLEKTVNNLTEENRRLESEITRLTESPSYAKKVLRDKYHVTDPDEDIVFFAD